MRRQYFDYRPRPQFRAFHRRKERFACISPRVRFTVSVRNFREAWSTQTSASSDLSINVRRVGKGARRTFYTISASLTARAVPTRQWWARHAILRVARP